MSPYFPGRRGWSMALLLLPVMAVIGCNEERSSAWSGYAEGDYVYLAASVPGTLNALSVRSGDQVVVGAALFRLDDADTRAALAEADARIAAAEAQAVNTTKGKRSDELAVARAQLAQAKVQASRATTELKRQQALVADEFISRSRLDDARTAEKQARDKVVELEAALRVARLPGRQDEQTAATALVEVAQQVRAQTLWRAQQAVVVAPAAGLIVETFYRPGEFVAAGQPVVSLLPATARKARFFVSESELGGLAIGQPVTIRCDGCGEPIAARISFISPQAEYTPPVIYSNVQRSRLIFMVEALPQVATDAPRLHPGQPLDVQAAASRPSGS